MIRINTIVIVLSMLMAGIACADHPTAGLHSGTSGPINTISASTLKKGSWMMGMRNEYLQFDSFSDAELIEFAEDGFAVESTNYLVSPFLGIAYGVTDEWMLSFYVPYVYRNGLKEGELESGEELAERVSHGGAVHHHGNAGGVGDITVFSQYCIYRSHEAQTEAAVMGGLKFPSGKTGATDSEGFVLEVDHQPGSGSWDPFVGIAVSRHVGNTSLDGNLLYHFAAVGSEDVNLGDFLHFNAAVSYRLGNREHVHLDPAVDESHSRVAFDLVLEINGEWREKLSQAGIPQDNHGGRRVFLAPGLRLTMWNRWSASFSVGIPVIQHLNGIQEKTTIRLITGIGFGL